MTPTDRFDPQGLALWRTDMLVDLGPLVLRIVSDVPDFAVLSYFSSTARPTGSAEDGREPDAEVWCVSTRDAPDHWPVDQTARARGFLKGYYVTDHAGPPVQMVSTDRRIVLFGPRLERIVWSYVVKWVLSRHALATGAVFLKAAAFAVEGYGILLVGRGGAGKTVMLNEFCRRGARFVTNSHALITGTTLQGVRTSMRMRPGPGGSDHLGVVTRAALDPGQVVVDPTDLFGAAAVDSVPLRHIAVVDYRGPARHSVEQFTVQEAYSVLEQFGLGINVYRLEEDHLDDVDGDYRAFAAAQSALQSRLRQLVQDVPCHSVTTDVRVEGNVAALRQLWCSV